MKAYVDSHSMPIDSSEIFLRGSLRSPALVTNALKRSHVVCLKPQLAPKRAGADLLQPLEQPLSVQVCPLPAD